MQDLRRMIEILLTPALLAQNAMRHKRNVHTRQRVDRVGQKLRMPCRIVQIGNRGADVGRPPVCRSAATAASFSGFLATRKSWAPSAAQMRQVASAIPDVAPRTRIFLPIFAFGLRADALACGVAIVLIQ